MKKITLLGAVAFLLLGTTSYAQNWRVGGNTALQMGPPGNPPILGTLAGNNQPLLFHTNGVGRMRINSNTGATACALHCYVLACS